MIRRPAAVLFDCDGVLADSEAVVNAIVAESLTALGWPLSAAEAQHAFLGLALPDMVPRIEARVGPLPEDWAEGLSHRIAAAMTERTMPIPGAVEAVHRVVAAGVPVACASNSARLELAAKLRGLGLAGVFGARVFSHEDVRRAKPWPDLYRAAAEACGASPGDCVVVEDSVPGVRAGLAAGCRVLGFAHETPAAVLAALGAEPFATMAELPGLLGLGD
ncbi:HAD family hydrolase [Plastoroseomonas arctica]|uniref:HAD family phosphatase n=1 Tax=Plastoroseomonas arctica TaxID=1509237 RepID=A0AAF1K6L4_9PROT|nr:HAD family phosphatase [Plastoroseomonas arctica]MBR0657594.1 HAD family phosphatase [Plastoroseomonas arctica]